ncbi:isocitrate/isopropylmalate dehydrogenase family protein [Allofrancisella guangzhouensis]|uniref:isocitrate/isopropylmalate family dehydrogenase n=1 Tax=Allofrancisella guangzhouensis TaxID=594679 RepID=UPI00068C2999|nr:isocitrate/isopropylmalate family dehydrogenase [Allofrancisella guangzhouensis]MBK2027384.1 isocitrate/isopropylmalate dehydrogenase family protein [Allofrancisella guangzhouensis]MBK2043431.1 isocitrate/isopropylmalate dehydrogenase family protein [Allofrancisella guangzhouensis]MBK2045200.1 isocitrate/isopropylmalate dehydrogenase family protein [Allofrancisella guangzhouensis]
MNNSLKKIAILPGDGVGQDVIFATMPVFEALSLDFDFSYGDVGWECWRKEGNPVPQKTWEIINNCDATLLGAITSKPYQEAVLELPNNLIDDPPIYVSPVIQLRQNLDLFANVRPISNINDRAIDFNLAVIRENTEGLYSGLDYGYLPDEIKSIVSSTSRWQNVNSNEACATLRLQTKFGLERLFKFAFEHARKYGFNKVTLADKPNVMRHSSHFVKTIFDKISSGYKGIAAEILNVDAVGLWLVRRPENFGVIVAENMFGDILSDVGAAVMGGLGFAPSGNYGSKGAYFEPVHGSAPRLSGKNIANPCAMFLTIAMLLDSYNYTAESEKIRKAIKEVIKEGKYLTYDMGGNTSTKEMANRIINLVDSPLESKVISLISTGSELVNGDKLDTNAQYFSQKIISLGGNVKGHQLVSDNQRDIKLAIEFSLNSNDCIIITGGLGPTSDDKTRQAVAGATGKELVFDEKSWKLVCDRLKRFNISVHDGNKQQAFFPKDSEILENLNGTAAGCKVNVNNKVVFMLPGPPSENQPMFEKYVIPYLEDQKFLVEKKNLTWKLLGVIEADIADDIDKIVSGSEVDVAYRWSYPYIDVKLSYPASKEFQLQNTISKVNRHLAKYTVSNDGRDSKTRLIDFISKNNLSIKITDYLTNGELGKLVAPYISDVADELEKIISIEMKGLEEFKQKLPYNGSTTLECNTKSHSLNYYNKLEIAYRGPEVEKYALHFACSSILSSLEKIMGVNNEA